MGPVFQDAKLLAFYSKTYQLGSLTPRPIGEAHRRYTRRINFREKWRGHLWQERFASFPMDERYLTTGIIAI